MFKFRENFLKEEKFQYLIRESYPIFSDIFD